MVNGKEFLPDGETITQMRNQFIGNHKGLDQLRRLLDDREADLVEVIKREDDNK